MILNEYYLTDYDMICRDYQGLTETLTMLNTTQVDRLIEARKQHEEYHERCAKGIALTRANQIVEASLTWG